MHDEMSPGHEDMSVQKMVVILGHPLTATRFAWLIELKGQRSGRGGQPIGHFPRSLGGSPVI